MIRIIVDEKTVKAGEIVNLNMIQAITGEYISDEMVAKAKAMQPNVAKAVGYTYNKLPDGGYEIVITDVAVNRMNGFIATWAPAIAAIVMRYKTEIKFMKKFAKKFIEAQKKMFASLHDDLHYDGLPADEWVDKSAKQWADNFNTVGKSKPGKTLEQKIDELNQYQEDLVNGKTKFELGTTEYIDEMVRVAKELGRLKAEKAKAEAE